MKILDFFVIGFLFDRFEMVEGGWVDVFFFFWGGAAGCVCMYGCSPTKLLHTTSKGINHHHPFIRPYEDLISWSFCVGILLVKL